MFRRFRAPVSIALVFVLSTSAARGDSAAELLRQARDAWGANRREQALDLAGKAIAADPKSPQAALARGQMREALGQHAEAVSDFDTAARLDPKLAEAFDSRGDAHLKLGKFAEAVADFDRFLVLRPREAPGHWRRGIALYYAGEYAAGREQFKGYESKDANDVENAVWHFLCGAKVDGVDKARAAMLKVGKDRRVPMTEVFELYRGKLKPADVLAAAEAGNATPEERANRLFYAHLYLGLYYDATGDPKQALEHIALAAGKYRSPHYMGDVARVHERVLREAATKR
jgi:lipoprotein NlpI